MAGLLAYLEDYSKAVIDGKIIACKKYKWSAQRFLKDLEQRGQWRWDFDELRAERYFQWMRLFKHEKGPMAGLTKEPVDYELFVYGNIYGWIDPKEEARRFRRSYEQLARKQSKSMDKGIQALFEISAFGEPAAEAYVAAAKKEQTRQVWGTAKALYEKSDFLKDAFTCKFDQELLQKVIKHKKSGSYFSRLSKDDRKNGDGTNPHFMVLDEYHLHETTEYYDIATSGMKTRKNPLLSIITTAGFELNNPCYRVEYDYVSKILDPDNPVENDRYFVAICELDRNDTGEKLIRDDGQEIEPDGIIDDMESDEAIQKSNPVTGLDPVTRENIRIEIAEARDKPEKMRDVKTKTFNIWVNERQSGYMNMGKWGSCGVELEELLDLINRNTDRRCIVGLDIGAKIDLTGAALEFKSPDEYYVIPHAFMPEESYLARLKEDKVPYDVWRRTGYLAVTEGAVVDYQAILDWVMSFCKEHEFKTEEWCLDPWGSIQISAQLMDMGETPIDVIQGIKTLSEPTKDFRNCVYNGKLKYAKNPLYTWTVGNAITRGDHNDNIMLDKAKSKQRIDPLAATINAHYRAMSAIASVYNTSGLRSLS